MKDDRLVLLLRRLVKLRVLLPVTAAAAALDLLPPVTATVPEDVDRPTDDDFAPVAPGPI